MRVFCKRGCARWARVSGAGRFLAGPARLRSPRRSRAAAVRPLVVEQSGEISVLERADQRDDLVGVEVVVVVHRGLSPVLLGTCGGALWRGLGAAGARPDRGLGGGL